MQNGNVRCTSLLAGSLIALMSSGCGYSEKEYMAKVNIANEYQRLAQQRQAALVTNEKKMKYLENALQSFQKNLAIVQTEKKRESEQKKINKLQLEQSREALKKINIQLENNHSRLASMEKSLEDAYQELAKSKDQLKRKDSQLQQINVLVRERVAQLKIKERQLSENTSQLKSLRLQLQETEEQLSNTGQQLEKTIGLNKKLEKGVRENLLQISSIQQKEKSLQSQLNELTENEQKLTALIEEYERALPVEDDETKTTLEHQQNLVASLREQLESDKVKISELSNRIALRLDERLLFDSGKAFIKATGFKILNKIGTVLKRIPEKHIQVEGHTDNLAIGASLRGKFATNWELSVARALSVVRYLVDVVKIDPSRISAAGFSFHQPVADNKTPEGRQINRRVEFTLIPLRSNEVNENNSDF